MQVSTALLAAVVVALLGAAILWSNPGRKVNWAVFVCSMMIAAWLACLHVATLPRRGEGGLYWVRWSCAIGGLIPICFWAVKETIATDMADLRWQWVVRRSGWLLFSVALVVLPFTDFFVPAHSTSAMRQYGWGYYVYMWSLLGLYAYMFCDAFRTSRRLSGARRLELQIWLGGGSAMVSSVIFIMALSAITGNRSFIRFQPLLVLLFYGGIAFAITARKIFDARQILLVGVEKAVLVTLVGGAAYVFHSASMLLLPATPSLIIATTLALWFAGVLNGWLDRVFRFYPRATSARHAAFTVARRETRVENLESAFLEILKGWGQSEHALILTGARGTLVGGKVEMPEDSPALAAIRQLRWATPERLARERSSPERKALVEFLAQHRLGVVVIGEGPTLTAIVAVGIAASRRPFTYPQVTQLMELASIMESALERAHFSVKAQHAEQLATVGLLGASLAHEIRNPLVTIKTFVQLLPKHYQDPVFREKFFSLIGDEVSRIDRLTEQLLDLASPRAYRAEALQLHPVLRTSLELVTAKAADKRIEFLTEFEANPDYAYTDASAAKQVLLNLCFNAIQAVESRTGPRWVKVATRNVPGGIEMSVEDSGPGIAPEIRPRLFQPFQSTKSSGFGLGLAICSDILAGLNASISVDPLAPGRGALFRVIFPCPA